MPPDRAALVALLAREGFIAAEDEADELLDAAAGDAARLNALAARRLTGEPLEWITGRVRFCGLDLHVAPGVYVPRWHSETLAERAVARLPEDGTAVDVCTGCGALAAVLRARRPGARVVATDVDDRAVACARDNGVDARHGDLLDPVAGELAGAVDVLVAIVPFVPEHELHLLQRDTFAFESPRAYAGGADGTAVLRRLLHDAPGVLRDGAAIVLGLGAGQPDLLAGDLDALGFGAIAVVRDEEGDVRGIEATWHAGAAHARPA